MDEDTGAVDDRLQALTPNLVEPRTDIGDDDVEFWSIACLAQLGHRLAYELDHQRPWQIGVAESLEDFLNGR